MCMRNLLLYAHIYIYYIHTYMHKQADYITLRLFVQLFYTFHVHEVVFQLCAEVAKDQKERRWTHQNV